MPADPDIERWVIAAALAVYGEAGWAGFTLHRVARRAKQPFTDAGPPGKTSCWPPSST